MRTPLSEEEKAFFKEFGERIVTFRKRRGLTQSQLAETLGISQPRLVTFEKGRRRMPLSELPGLSEALGVPVEELLGIERKPGKPGPPSRLERQLEELARLPKSKQRVVSEMLDGLLQQSG